MAKRKFNKSIKIQGRCIFCGLNFDLSSQGIAEHAESCTNPRQNIQPGDTEPENSTIPEVIIVPPEQIVRTGTLYGGTIKVIFMTRKLTVQDERIVDLDSDEKLGMRTDLELYQAGAIMFNEFYERWKKD